MDEWVGGWIDGWMGECMDGWVNVWMGGWMYGWMGSWVAECSDSFLIWLAKMTSANLENPLSNTKTYCPSFCATTFPVNLVLCEAHLRDGNTC